MDKGNFIESKIADHCESLGYTYKKSKAGLTWDYLQFVHNESQILFLIKNAAYFNPTAFSQAKLAEQINGKQPTRTYLHELSKINANIDFPLKQPIQLSLEFEEQYQQEVFSFIKEKQVQEELSEFQTSYQEFHILTYSLNEAYQISSILHYLPNPEDNVAYLVEDLSDLISGADLTDEEREILAPESDDDILDPAAFDLAIIDDKQRGSQ